MKSSAVVDDADPQIHALAVAAMSGNRRALARLISLVEGGGAAALQAIAALYPHTGRAQIVGVTGPPGAGKSTLVCEMARAYRQSERSVGIVAVDPSSPFSGGALLGDRIRMRELSGDPEVFIRSMATRGSLGGLARATADVTCVLDAAGYKVILVETVGAGQNEVDIGRLAHTTIVIQVPASGDEIQAIKAGMLEIADLIVVNKADLPGADVMVEVLEAMLGLQSPPADLHHVLDAVSPVTSKGSPSGSGDWRPRVIKTSALRSEGIADLIEAVAAHAQYARASGRRAAHEREYAARQLRSMLQQEMYSRFLAQIGEQEIQAAVDRIASRQEDPYSAAIRLAATCRLSAGAA